MMADWGTRGITRRQLSKGGLALLGVLGQCGCAGRVLVEDGLGRGLRNTDSASAETNYQRLTERDKGKPEAGMVTLRPDRIKNGTGNRAVSGQINLMKGTRYGRLCDAAGLRPPDAGGRRDVRTGLPAVRPRTRNDARRALNFGRRLV